jgi:hypothetical protein
MSRLLWASFAACGVLMEADHELIRRSAESERATQSSTISERTSGGQLSFFARQSRCSAFKLSALNNASESGRCFSPGSSLSFSGLLCNELTTGSQKEILHDAVGSLPHQNLLFAKVR